MSAAARIDELRKKFDENQRRYFAPLANELRKEGNLSEAIALCRMFLPKQPEHMSGYIVFGQALYESEELAEARIVFEQALALDPENLKALRHLGDIARREGDSAAARRWYERVLEADPRNDDIAAQLATLANPGFPEAVVGIDVEAESPTAPMLADPFALDGDVSEPVRAATTVDAFEEGLITPEWPDTTELLERVVHPPSVTPSFVASRTPDAVFAFGVEPGDPVVLPPLDDDDFLVDDVLLDETSQDNVDEVVPEDPSSAFVTETMGELLVSQGFTAQAIPVYEELVRRRPYDSLLTSRLSELQEQLNDEIAPLAPISTPLSSVTPTVAHAAVSSVSPIELAPVTMPLTAKMRFARLAARRIPSRTAVRISAAAGVPEQGLTSLFGNEVGGEDDTAARTLADAFSATDERFPPVNDMPFEEAMLGTLGRLATPRLPATPVASTPVVETPSGAFSFDRFFPDPATGSFPSVSDGTELSADGSRRTPTSILPVRPPAVSDDLAQFSAWLKGLGPS